MHRLKIINSILLVLLLFSCTDSDDNHFESQGIQPVIKSSHTFKAGDAIGIFVEKRKDKEIRAVAGTSNYQSNIKWIYQEDGSWSPANSTDMIYSSTDGMPLDIYAYYPYTEQANNNGISVSSASPVMTGAVYAVNNNESQPQLILNNKTVLVKVVIPDDDIISFAQVSILNILAGGTIYPAEIGNENDFESSSIRENQELIYENGSYTIYLPEQVFEKNKHLLDIKYETNTIKYTLSEQVSISGEDENIIIVNTPVENIADLPNTYMLKPGSELFISVRKAFDIWKTNNLLASTSPDLSGEVSTAILWQEDLQEIVENIQVIGKGENAVIHIKTSPGKSGNVLVAAKIGDDIRWSWQLWVSDYNPTLKENGTTYDFNGLIFMDRNLGATSGTQSGGDRTFGLHYQWGRKDPFQTRGRVETINVVNETATNLANSILYPHSFITSSSSPNDWYAKTNNAGLDRWNNDQNKKTAYDPCPKGWRVPVEGINNESPWNGISLPEEDNWGNGWLFNGTTPLGYYPAAGQRAATGTTTYAGSAGYYYTAKTNATFNFDFTSINLSFGGGKAAARSVRCVKEE